MTPTTLFILAATCSLAVPVALFLVLWRRDTRRLAADNQASEARERDATSRLAAAEARLAAAEQAASAEKELRQRYEEQVQALTEQRTRTEAELAALRASSEAEIASLRAKNAEDRAAEKAEREKLEETFRAQFRNLATEILGEQSKHFKETNKESLDVLLKPFRDNIAEFRKRVEDIYTTQTAQRGELKAELKNLMELNRRITTETTNLTNALKGNSKVQGDWGEMLLEPRQQPVVKGELGQQRVDLAAARLDGLQGVLLLGGQERGQGGPEQGFPLFVVDVAPGLPAGLAAGHQLFHQLRGEAAVQHGVELLLNMQWHGGTSFFS